MIIKDGELHRINVKIRELAIQESKKQITEEECKKQTEILKAKANEMTQNILKIEKEKLYPKRAPDKKTVPTTLGRFW